MELEVLDVDALGAECLRDPGEHARAVDHVHREPLQGAGLGERVLEQAAAMDGRLADPAGEEARVAPLEGPLELLRAPAVLGERARSSSALSRKMSTQMRGLAPATRVMSRRTAPPASGSWPSTRTEPAWFRRRFASACGRWLVSASRRSWAAGDGHRDGAERGDEAVHEAVAIRLRLRQRRQEPGGAVEELGVA